ncbi:MAG: 1-phosphofructokinase family hexose kinase [Gammaproteobacteria bacterium]
MTAILTVTMNPSIDVSASTGNVLPVRKLRCTDVRRDPGGGGINVARVIKRLGGDCRALYPAGGAPGHLLNRLLDQEGILSMPVDAAADTRESLTVLDKADGNQYRFVLPGAPLSAQEWQACLDRVAGLADPPDYIVASGSLPPGVPEDFYARLAHIASATGARIVLDTSGPALATALEQGVHLVKPNLRELRNLTGLPLDREGEWVEAAAPIVGSGKADIVALTLGDQGALLVNRDLQLRAPAVPVAIASAVGAGDSFLAGLVWRLAEGAGLEDAFRYAVATGTAALLTPGTELARKDDTDQLYHEVRLYPTPKPDQEMI